MSFFQQDLFGVIDGEKPLLRPSQLPEPLNDWAFGLMILIKEPKPIDFLRVADKYGMTKFQSRLGELSQGFPDLIKRQEVTVRKRLGRSVNVVVYWVEDKQEAMQLYLDTINKRNVSRIFKKQKDDGDI